MDLTDDYANGIHIPDGDTYYGQWVASAAAFRDRWAESAELDQSYGRGPRERVDLFRPKGVSRGLVVFVHGGYWMQGDKSLWSHLAEGPVMQGWTVAIPSFDLCPAVRIDDITRQIDRAIGILADRVAGPIRIAGHSAGGHLAARMACPDMYSDLSSDWRSRVAMIVPISPLGDLAPLMQTEMNAILRIDRTEAQAESPVHHRPGVGPVTIWVGGAERPVFLEQALGLGKAWGCPVVVDPGVHHFNVIDGLQRPDSPLTEALLG